jgi:PhnB protein
MATARRIPEGHEGVTAYLTIKDAAKAIDFYKRVFGATEVMRLADKQGRIGHAELKIGNRFLMLSDEHPEYGRSGPQPGGGRMPVGMHLYVEDVDIVYKKALAAGAKEARPPTNEFYGDRAAQFLDPFGHQWMISTHVEDVSVTEMQHRFEEFMSKQGQSGQQPEKGQAQTKR